jgi:hypothetical protein
MDSWVVVSGLTGEVEDWQISCYMRGPYKEKGQVVPEDSNDRFTELIATTTTTRCLHIAKCYNSGSDKLYQSICGQNCCNTEVY